MHSATPPLSVVRKFVHLLDLGDGDIREEAELLRLREEVVRSIRFNRQLEADLDLMDLKIGLLVRNRATLQVRPRHLSSSRHTHTHTDWLLVVLVNKAPSVNRKWCLTVRN